MKRKEHLYNNTALYWIIKNQHCHPMFSGNVLKRLLLQLQLPTLILIADETDIEKKSIEGKPTQAKSEKK